MIYKTFNTKRYLFYPLKSYINKALLDEDILGDSSVISLTGIRKVGKTVLLHQLNNMEPDKSVYISCDTLPYDYDFYNELMQLLNNGINKFYFDEVNRIHSDNIDKFIQSVKDVCKFSVCVITGSVPNVIKSISNSIGRCVDVEVPMIYYIEKLMWKNLTPENDMDSNFLSSSSLEIFKSISNNEHFIQYLRSYLTSEEECESYVNSVVTETLKSTLRSTSLENIDCNYYLANLDAVVQCVKYLAHINYIYTINRKFVPVGTYNISDSIEGMKNFINYNLSYNESDNYCIAFNKQFIHDVCNILSVSRLAQNVNTVINTGLASNYLELSGLVTGTSIKIIDIDKNMSTIPAMLFNYPWFSGMLLSINIDDSRLLDFCIEKLIHNRMVCLYCHSDVYRNSDNEEIDLIYCTGSVVNNSIKIHGLEIKNRKIKSVKRSLLNKYQRLSDLIPLTSWNISTEEDISQDIEIYNNPFSTVKTLPNHLIVMTLELVHVLKSYMLLYCDNEVETFGLVPSNFSYFRDKSLVEWMKILKLI